jgi:competence/damage-inducible protein CinA-like protein
MPAAEIITIGTEILLGEIIDTNSRYLARRLRTEGIDVFRTTSIGDNPKRIAQVIQGALKRADIIITTGGLGPTVDDPTREAIAIAFGVETEFYPELWEQVIDRFARFNRYPTENNRRQAFLPNGALPIENSVGTAPAFLMESGERVVISLPGVPSEMEHLMDQFVLPYLKERYDLDHVLKVRLVHTAGVGESQIDARIGDLETLSNPTVGLAAHSGQVDVRITAKASNEAEAEALIQEVEAQIRERLGNWIYGVDDETLEVLAMRKLMSHNWNLAVAESGLEGKLVRRFAAFEHGFLRGEVLPKPPSNPNEWLEIVKRYRNSHQADVCLGVALYPGQEVRDIHLALLTPEEEKFLHVPYGGPPKLAPRRAVNLGLNLLRKI